MVRTAAVHSIFSFTSDTLASELTQRYGKGLFHARALLRHVYRTHDQAPAANVQARAANDQAPAADRSSGLENAEGFLENQTLARSILQDFSFKILPVSRVISDDGTIKFTLTLHDSHQIEAVIIPMKNYTSLCVSSQAGCARSCSFCRTGSMGLIRNLSAEEIVMQYAAARYIFNKEIRNVVFMGMGEPFDNLTEVLKAVDILTDPFGPALHMRRISLSTCGHCAGIDSLCSIIEAQPEKKYQLMTMSVSLHSPFDDVRSLLMPVNKTWPLAVLRKTLEKYSICTQDAVIYFEYLIIPSVNDRDEDARCAAQFVGAFKAKINVIAFQPPENSPYPAAQKSDVDAFWSKLRALGVSCWCRVSKGSQIKASCGQLAT